MRVVVLNDGETYTDIDGCTILWVPDYVAEENMDTYVKEFGAAGTPVSEALAAWEKSTR